MALKPAAIPPVPAVLPVNEMSLPVKPVTGSLNVAVRLIGEVVVGSAWPEAWLIVTVGAVVSTVKTGTVKPISGEFFGVTLSFHVPGLAAKVAVRQVES